MHNRIHPENPLKIQINHNNEKTLVSSPIRSNSYSKLQSAVTPSNRLTHAYKKEATSASIKPGLKFDPNHLGSPTKQGSPMKKNPSEIDEYEEKFDTRKSLIKLKRNLTNNKAIQEGLMNSIKAEAAAHQQQQQKIESPVISNQVSPVENPAYSNPTTPKDHQTNQNGVSGVPTGK
jgi:hypothetical protein